MKLNLFACISIALCLLISPASAKKKKDNDTKKLNPSMVSGMKWRGIGPSMTSGRIADFAVNPDRPAEYYVAVAAGHIWKTTNNGITYQPVFDNHGVYSMGCIAMDPNNHHTLWVGTGEGNSQRAIGYGNGVYKTMDGGKTWKNMGLKDSRQISRILIHPCNSDIVFVAAQGSIWGPNKERGLYKTTDGGKSWKKVISISENTGVRSVEMMPGNPKVMYATTEQRRRRGFTKIGGGPEAAVYRSTDGGDNWTKVENGLPSGALGGMGLAVTPANPDYVYLMIEAEEGKGGTYFSGDRGVSWSKRSDHYSSGQYYCKIYGDPNDADKIYSVETISHYSENGGKTWKSIPVNKKHVDDHAFWIDPNDPEHFLIGSDGGIYESFDFGKNYDYKANLPVTQFYRVNVDNTKPFYWVYGGTQDNNSFGGPNQVISRDGASLADWITTLGGDGFWQAIDPENPNIVYSEYQYGNVYRFDKTARQGQYIKPQPQEGELTFRWNWDAPMVISKHDNKRLYIAANKLFKSNDRGNNWEEISGDLTRDMDRNDFKVMGKYWPSNAVAKDVSTSQWGTIVAFSESPLNENLLYVGTDDGLIQVTEDGGKVWRKVSNFPGIPEYTYVSDLWADRFDENVVYATFNNMKSDDFKPYVLKSTDKGKSWTSIAANLPENGSVHTFIQDFKAPQLLFIGTEFNAFFSADGGKNWTKLGAGIPDVAVRDLAIQEDECDLVAATFGRGFYIIDNYDALRNMTADYTEKTDAMLYDIPNALMYVQSSARYGEGSNVWHAPNPKFGAEFTYYIKNVPKTMKAKRLKKEQELFKASKPIPQPDRATLDAEKHETAPYLVFEIKDEQGNSIRRLYKKASKGLNRMYWNLTLPNMADIESEGKEFKPFSNGDDGMYAMPGKYTVDLFLNHNDSIKHLSGPVSFETVLLNNQTLPDPNPQASKKFYEEFMAFYREFNGASNYFEELGDRIVYLRQAIHQSPKATDELQRRAKELQVKHDAIAFLVEGTPAKASWEEVPPELMPMEARFQSTAQSIWRNTSGITGTAREGLKIMKKDFADIWFKIEALDQDFKSLLKDTKAYNLPYIPGMPVIKQ